MEKMNALKLMPLLSCLSISFMFCSDEGKKAVAVRHEPVLTQEIPGYDSTRAKFLTESNELGDGYNNVISPRVLFNNAPYYRIGDSIPVGRLRHGTPLHLVNLYGRWGDRYRFALRHDTFEISSGHIASHYFKTDRYEYYFCNVYSQAYNPLEEGFTILKFRNRDGKCVDTLRVDSVRADHVIRFDATEWPGVDLLLAVDEINACCACTNHRLFLAVTDSGLVALFKASEFADDGGGGWENTAATLPRNPQKGLIIASRSWGWPVMKKDADPEADFSEDDVERYEEHDSTWYLRWDGKQVVPLNRENN